MTTPAEARRQAVAERRARRAAVEQPDVVMAAAAAYLAARPRTVHETQVHLEGLGFRPDLCRGVVSRLRELGYLDDAAYAQAWVEARDRARPRGETALRRELARRGVADVTVSEVLAARRTVASPTGRLGASRPGPGGSEPAGDRETGGADVLAARRLLERRLPSLLRESDVRRRRQKAYALLARNGFDPDICREESLRVTRDGALDPAPEE